MKPNSQGRWPRERQVPKRYSSDDIEAIVARYNKGETTRSIAEDFGVTRQAMHIVIKANTLLRGRITASNPPRKKSTAWATLAGPSCDVCSDTATRVSNHGELRCKTCAEVK